MTSLDLEPITSTPSLDPSQVNYVYTPTGWKVCAYYSPHSATWVIYDYYAGEFHKVFGIDASDWPEVWAEIISKEQQS